VDRNDIIDLLAIVKSVDNRTVEDYDIQVWLEMLVRFDKDDCLDAIMAHRAQQPGAWLEPGHVVQRVKAKINDRLERQDPDERGWAHEPSNSWDKGVDGDEYPVSWTSEERLAAYWGKIESRRGPVVSSARHSAMEHIRSVLNNDKQVSTVVK
jgi:hypothetical protein